jgi:hypothetical protein
MSSCPVEFLSTLSPLISFSIRFWASSILPACPWCDTLVGSPIDDTCRRHISLLYKNIIHYILYITLYKNILYYTLYKNIIHYNIVSNISCRFLCKIKMQYLPIFLLVFQEYCAEQYMILHDLASAIWYTAKDNIPQY